MHVLASDANGRCGQDIEGASGLQRPLEGSHPSNSAAARAASHGMIMHVHRPVQHLEHRILQYMLIVTFVMEVCPILCTVVLNAQRCRHLGMPHCQSSNIVLPLL